MEFDYIKIISIILGVMIVLGIVTYYGLTGEKTYLDYTYTTVTNNTNTTLNGTQSLTIGHIVSISGETPYKNLTVKTYNPYSSNLTIIVYLNNIQIGTLNAENQTNTTKTFTDVEFITNSINNLTYGS